MHCHLSRSAVTFILGIGLYISFLIFPPAYASHPLSYRVTVSADLTLFDVSTCVTASGVQELVTKNQTAWQNLIRAELHRKGQVTPLIAKPVSSGAVLPLANSKKGDCIHYRIKTRHVASRRWKADIRQGKQIIVAPEDWLWKPTTMKSSRAIEVRFDLPAGVRVSAPWKRIGKSETSVTYRIRPRDPDWEARIAIGVFHTEDIKIANATVHMAILNHRHPVDIDQLKQWVNANLQALTQVYGALPVPQVQLLIVPIGKDREAVPWGQVMRGGGDAVHLYIDQYRPIEEFMRDWVLIHELSHLLHPKIEGNDIWLSEGLASYYQNVLRARAGMLSEVQAWQKLHAGFERGIKGTPKNRSLTEVAETMMRDRTFMRVYWSGAAISLLADIELRKQSRGRQSLDSILKKYQLCCLPIDRPLTGIEFMKKLDVLSGTTVFTALYRTHANSVHFPDLKPAYAELGLKAINGDLLLMQDESGYPLRKAIMQSR